MAQNHAFSVRTLDEDFEIAEQIQAGLDTGANTHFRFARFEGALTDWRRRLDAKLEVLASRPGIFSRACRTLSAGCMARREEGVYRA